MWFVLMLVACGFCCGEMDTRTPDIHNLANRLQLLEIQTKDKDIKYSSLMSSIIGTLTSANHQILFLKARLSSTEAENKALREELTSIKHQANKTKEICDVFNDIVENNFTELISNVSRIESDLTSLHHQLSLTNSECKTCEINVTNRTAFEQNILANEQVLSNRLALMKSQVWFLSANVTSITATQRKTDVNVLSLSRRLTSIRNVYTGLKLKTDDIRAKLAERSKHVAFEVESSSQNGRSFTIPPNTAMKLRRIKTNQGGAYNRTSGIMKVPKDGLYMFWFHIRAVFSDKSTHRATVQIRSTTNLLAESNAKMTQSLVTEEARGFAVASLVLGERVWLTCDSRIVLSDVGSVSSFGGILLLN